MIGPSFWLDQRKAARQTAFRRALPDAMDVLIICLEGGLNLSAAIPRVRRRKKSPKLAESAVAMPVPRNRDQFSGK